MNSIINAAQNIITPETKPNWTLEESKTDAFDSVKEIANLKD